MSGREILTDHKKIVLTRRFDVVGIEIHCGDEYEAITLFDDVNQRMEKGEGVYIGKFTRGKV